MVCVGSGHLFFDPKQKMGRLPTDLVDRIMLDHMDAQTLGVLYDRGALKDIVSAPAAREIEEKVLQRARQEHKRLLSSVHHNLVLYLFWYKRYDAVILVPYSVQATGVPIHDNKCVVKKCTRTLGCHWNGEFFDIALPQTLVSRAVRIAWAAANAAIAKGGRPMCPCG